MKFLKYTKTDTFLFVSTAIIPIGVIILNYFESVKTLGIVLIAIGGLGFILNIRKRKKE